jgi:hypothetical protein
MSSGLCIKILSFLVFVPLLQLQLQLQQSTTIMTTALASSSSRSSNSKLIYGIPGSGWTSSEWNWGSPFGTGHDCAMICRQRYSTVQSRAALVDDLLLCGSATTTTASTDTTATTTTTTDKDELDFEEIKLIMALVWQKARKTGLEAFGVILDEMAKAERYEVDRRDNDDDDDDETKLQHSGDEYCSRLLVQDIQSRYMWLEPTLEDKMAMNLLWYDTDDYRVARCRCCGLVLKSIGFVERGF